MGHSRKWTGGLLVVPPAPVLTALGSPNVSWTWSGTNPSQWELDFSTGPTGPWNIAVTVAGTARTSSFASGVGLYFRIYGLNGSGARITGISNIVQQT